MKSCTFVRWPISVLSLVALVVLSACNTAGDLPQGPVTPIVPPPGAVATRSAQPATAPVVSTAPAELPQAAPGAPVTLPASQPSAQAALQLYPARCAPCHGDTGKGDGPQSQQVVAQMGGKLPNFADAAYARAVKPTDWFNVLSTGRMQKGMPPFTSLTADQRWDLVAYLYTLSIPQDRLDRGKSVYADKCVSCHGTTGRAASPGAPDLSDPAKMAAKSQADVEAVIANGRGAMPGFGPLSQDDRLAVADYVRSLSMALNKVVLPTGQAAIAGSLVNGTAGAKAPGNLPLTLYALSPDGSTLMFTRTAQADASGQFTFDKLDSSASILYGIQTQYLKATYTSDPLTFAHGGLTLTVPITVYETSADASGLRVDQMHMFFDFLEPGKTSVGQLFVVSNSSDRAYIGTDGTSVHLPLPTGATNVQFQDGELGGRYQPVKDGFADTDAVSPGTGTTQILVSYDLAYDGKKLDLSLPVIYPVKSVNVLAPEGGVKLTSAQLTLAGSRAVQGGNMVNFVGGNLAAGSTLAMQLSGAATVAVSGAPPTSASTATSPVLIIAAALLLVAVAIVAFVWLRQQRVEAEVVEEEVEDADAEARQDELLSEMAALDDDLEAGRIQEKDYREQRAALKAELKELMTD